MLVQLGLSFSVQHKHLTNDRSSLAIFGIILPPPQKTNDIVTKLLNFRNRIKIINLQCIAPFYAKRTLELNIQEFFWNFSILSGKNGL